MNYLADVLGYDIYVIQTENKELPPYYPLSEKVHIIHLDLNFNHIYTTIVSVAAIVEIQPTAKNL